MLSKCLIASVVLVATLGSAVASSNIVVVGDSMGAYSGQYVQTYCGGSTVINKGQGGTTADQWTDGRATAAFAGVTGVTHVWISLLGNDYFGNCALTSAQAATKLTAAYDSIKAAAIAAGNTGAISYVLTSYCNPTGTDTCVPGYDVSKIQAAMTTVAAAQSDVTFVDIGTACGGSNQVAGDAQYFVDAVHLNKRGYCRSFQLAGVQTALGCTARTTECTCTTVTGQCTIDPIVCPTTGDCDTTITPTPAPGPTIPPTTPASSAASALDVAVPAVFMVLFAAAW